MAPILSFPKFSWFACGYCLLRTSYSRIFNPVNVRYKWRFGLPESFPGKNDAQMRYSAASKPPMSSQPCTDDVFEDMGCNEDGFWLSERMIKLQTPWAADAFKDFERSMLCLNEDIFNVSLDALLIKLCDGRRLDCYIQQDAREMEHTLASLTKPRTVLVWCTLWINMSSFSPKASENAMGIRFFFSKSETLLMSHLTPMNILPCKKRMIFAAFSKESWSFFNTFLELKTLKKTHEGKTKKDLTFFFDMSNEHPQGSRDRDKVVPFLQFPSCGVIGCVQHIIRPFKFSLVTMYDQAEGSMWKYQAKSLGPQRLEKCILSLIGNDCVDDQVVADAVDHTANTGGRQSEEGHLYRKEEDLALSRNQENSATEKVLQCNPVAACHPLLKRKESRRIMTRSSAKDGEVCKLAATGYQELTSEPISTTKTAFANERTESLPSEILNVDNLDDAPATSMLSIHHHQHSSKTPFPRFFSSLGETLITRILSFSSIKAIISFASTCKRHFEISETVVPGVFDVPSRHLAKNFQIYNNNERIDVVKQHEYSSLKKGLFNHQNHSLVWMRHRERSCRFQICPTGNVEEAGKLEFNETTRHTSNTLDIYEGLFADDSSVGILTEESKEPVKDGSYDVLNALSNNTQVTSSNSSWLNTQDAPSGNNMSVGVGIVPEDIVACKSGEDPMKFMASWIELPLQSHQRIPGLMLCQCAYCQEPVIPKLLQILSAISKKSSLTDAFKSEKTKETFSTVNSISENETNCLGNPSDHSEMPVESHFTKDPAELFDLSVEESSPIVASEFIGEAPASQGERSSDCDVDRLTKSGLNGSTNHNNTSITNGSSCSSMCDSYNTLGVNEKANGEHTRGKNPSMCSNVTSVCERSSGIHEQGILTGCSSGCEGIAVASSLLHSSPNPGKVDYSFINGESDEDPEKQCDAVNKSIDDDPEKQQNDNIYTHSDKGPEKQHNDSWEGVNPQIYTQSEGKTRILVERKQEVKRGLKSGMPKSSSVGYFDEFYRLFIDESRYTKLLCLNLIHPLYHEFEGKEVENSQRAAPDQLASVCEAKEQQEVLASQSNSVKMAGVAAGEGWPSSSEEFSNLSLYLHVDMRLCMIGYQGGRKWPGKRHSCSKDEPRSPYCSETANIMSSSCTEANADLQQRRAINVRGGIFCDEPGLGKTLSMLSLCVKSLYTLPEIPRDARFASTINSTVILEQFKQERLSQGTAALEATARRRFPSKFYVYSKPKQLSCVGNSSKPLIFDPFMRIKEAEKFHTDILSRVVQTDGDLTERQVADIKKRMEKLFKSLETDPELRKLYSEDAALTPTDSSMLLKEGSTEPIKRQQNCKNSAFHAKISLPLLHPSKIPRPDLVLSCATLIVCPPPLVSHWASEIKKWFGNILPADQVIIIEKISKNHFIPDRWTLASSKFVICSSQVLTQHYKQLFSYPLEFNNSSFCLANSAKTSWFPCPDQMALLTLFSRDLEANMWATVNEEDSIDNFKRKRKRSSAASRFEAELSRSEISVKSRRTRASLSADLQIPSKTSRKQKKASDCSQKGNSLEDEASTRESVDSYEANRDAEDTLSSRREDAASSTNFISRDAPSVIGFTNGQFAIPLSNLDKDSVCDFEYSHTQDEVPHHSPFEVYNPLAYSDDDLNLQRGELGVRAASIQQPEPSRISSGWNTKPEKGGKKPLQACITNFPAFSPLLGVHWQRLVIDEGHKMSNSDTNYVKICRLLVAEKRWVMTGTPTSQQNLQVGLKSLKRLLEFLRHPLVCSGEAASSAFSRSWDLAAHGDIACLYRLYRIVASVLVRHSKWRCESLPKLDGPVAFCITPTQAEKDTYNDLVQLTQRNLYCTYYSRYNPDSLLHHSHRDQAYAALWNLRFACTISSESHLHVLEKWIDETVEMLANKHSLYINEYPYNYSVSRVYYVTQVFLNVKSSLRYVVQCDKCKRRIRFPLLVPCKPLHLMCSECLFPLKYRENWHRRSILEYCPLCWPFYPINGDFFDRLQPPVEHKTTFDWPYKVSAGYNSILQLDNRNPAIVAGGVVHNASIRNSYRSRLQAYLFTQQNGEISSTAKSIVDKYFDGSSPRFGNYQGVDPEMLVARLEVFSHKHSEGFIGGVGEKLFQASQNEKNGSRKSQGDETWKQPHLQEQSNLEASSPLRETLFSEGDWQFPIQSRDSPEALENLIRESDSSSPIGSSETLSSLYEGGDSRVKSSPRIQLFDSTPKGFFPVLRGTKLSKPVLTLCNSQKSTFLPVSLLNSDGNLSKNSVPVANPPSISTDYADIAAETPLDENSASSDSIVKPHTTLSAPELPSAKMAFALQFSPPHFFIDAMKVINIEDPYKFLLTATMQGHHRKNQNYPNVMMRKAVASSNYSLSPGSFKFSQSDSSRPTSLSFLGGSSASFSAPLNLNISSSARLLDYAMSALGNLDFLREHRFLSSSSSTFTDGRISSSSSSSPLTFKSNISVFNEFVRSSMSIRESFRRYKANSLVANARNTIFSGPPPPLTSEESALLLKTFVDFFFAKILNDADEDDNLFLKSSKNVVVIRRILEIHLSGKYAQNNIPWKLLVFSDPAPVYRFTDGDANKDKKVVLGGTTLSEGNDLKSEPSGKKLSFNPRVAAEAGVQGAPVSSLGSILKQRTRRRSFHNTPERLDDELLVKACPKIIVASSDWLQLFMLGIFLDKCGIKCARFFERAPKEETSVAIRDFAFDTSTSTLLLGTHIGAHGLDLSCASHILILDPLTDPNIEQQVISRAHRVGALRNVHVEVFLLKGTVEENILKYRGEWSSTSNLQDSRIDTTQALNASKNVNSHPHQRSTSFLLNSQAKSQSSDSKVTRRQHGTLRKKPSGGTIVHGGRDHLRKAKKSKDTRKNQLKYRAGIDASRFSSDTLAISEGSDTIPETFSFLNDMSLAPQVSSSIEDTFEGRDLKVFHDEENVLDIRQRRNEYLLRTLSTI